MTEVQYRTENGVRYAFLPAADYDRLVQEAQDAADIEAVRRHQAEKPRGIPGSVVNRIMDGENPIRVWREYRELTQVELAARAAIARPYLSQIETSVREMSVSTLRKMAEILDTEMEFLI